MVSISELREEHRAIGEQAEAMLRIVAAPVADAAAVARLRWKLAQALLDHTAHEEAPVYDHILAFGDAAAAAAARRCRGEYGTLGAAFARYIADWPVDRINRHWDEFRADTEVMMAAIAIRIAVEDDELYPLAEKIEARQRAA